MFVIEATLYFRKNPQQPDRINEVVEGSEARQNRSRELSQQGYSVLSWPLDDEDEE